MKNIILTVLVLVGFIAGCATVPKDDIKIQTEADPKVNFSAYKSYAWLGSIAVLNDPQGVWKSPQFDVDAELVFLINEALRKRGMSESNSNPDMLVAYAAGADMDALKVKENPDTKISTLENVPQTGLIVLLLDPQTEVITWAGVATGEIKNLESDIAKKRLAYAINSMFKELPR